MNGKKGKRSKKMRAEPCEQAMTYNIDLVSVKCLRNRLIFVSQWSENYPNTLIPNSNNLSLKSNIIRCDTCSL